MRRERTNDPGRPSSPRPEPPRWAGPTQLLFGLPPPVPFPRNCTPRDRRTASPPQYRSRPQFRETAVQRPHVSRALVHGQGRTRALGWVGPPLYIWCPYRLPRLQEA
nr:MAG TPA: hypothetical protein [Caudoviricetes sp.]